MKDQHSIWPTPCLDECSQESLPIWGSQDFCKLEFSSKKTLQMLLMEYKNEVANIEDLTDHGGDI